MTALTVAPVLFTVPDGVDLLTRTLDARVAAALSDNTVRAARAELEALEATDDALFRASAESTLALQESGVSNVKSAEAAKIRKEEYLAEHGVSLDLYTSGSAVGFHTLTGTILRLPGELTVSYVEMMKSGKSVVRTYTARRIQTLVKQLDQKPAKAALKEQSPQTLDDAVRVLEAALKAKNAPPAPDGGTGGGDDSGDENLGDSDKTSTRKVPTVDDEIEKFVAGIRARLGKNFSRETWQNLARLNSELSLKFKVEHSQQGDGASAPVADNAITAA